MAKIRKPADQPSGSSELSADAVRALAYQLYCENGCQDGHDLEHWLEAERLVRQSPNRPVLRKVV